MTEVTYGRRRLYLMRHGHVDYFAPDLSDFTAVHLTPVGREQAQAAGGALHQICFDHVFHSGLPRTRQTAQLVLDENENTACEPEIAEGFQELRGGVFHTDSRVELAARLAYSFDSADQPDADFLPGGELFSDAYERLVKALHDLCFTRDWKTALLVAHEGVNRILLGYATGAGLAGIGHFEQDLGCINILDIDIVPTAGGPHIERIIIKAMNVTPYDAVKSALPRTSLEHLFEIDFGGGRPLSQIKQGNQ